MRKLEQTQNKIFPDESLSRKVLIEQNSQGKNKERILRKTYEIIERPAYTSGTKKTFTTKPKRFRIRRGHTIVIRRCKQIMKHLWQMGFKHGALVRREPIEGAIFYCAGGDYRTIKKYLGFRKLLRKGNALNPPQTLYIKGYLERLHFIERAKWGIYRLHHEVVPLSYHYRESLVPHKTPLQNFVNVSSAKQFLCVRGEAKEMGYEGDMASPKKQQNKQTQHTHKSEITESILTLEESRILNAIPKEIPDRDRVQRSGG